MARYPTSRAERIALDIARQKNAEFLAKQPAPLVSDSTIASLKRKGPELPEGAAQAAPVVPAGYALVPLEITEAMHVAAVKAAHRSTGNDDFPPNVWRAMLAAATPGATHGQ